MRKKILVADDSLTIQKVVELMFSDTEYLLTCVSNGRLALEKAREDPPDLILADVVMPEKNGYEVCEEIEQDDRDPRGRRDVRAVRSRAGGTARLRCDRVQAVRLPPAVSQSGIDPRAEHPRRPP